MKLQLRLISLMLIVGLHGLIFMLVSLQSTPQQKNLVSRSVLEFQLVAPSSAPPISNVRHQSITANTSANLKTSKNRTQPTHTAWLSRSEKKTADQELLLQAEGKEVTEAPTVNIHQLRQLALSDDKSVSKSPAQVIAEKNRSVETLESKLAKASEKAVKQDCRTSYASLGLLAAIPLAMNAANDKLCKW